LHVWYHFMREFINEKGIHGSVCDIILCSTFMPQASQLLCVCFIWLYESLLHEK